MSADTTPPDDAGQYPTTGADAITYERYGVVETNGECIIYDRECRMLGSSQRFLIQSRLTANWKPYRTMSTISRRRAYRTTIAGPGVEQRPLSDLGEPLPRTWFSNTTTIRTDTAAVSQGLR